MWVNNLRVLIFTLKHSASFPDPFPSHQWSLSWIHSLRSYLLPNSLVLGRSTSRTMTDNDAKICLRPSDTYMRSEGQSKDTKPWFENGRCPELDGLGVDMLKDHLLEPRGVWLYPDFSGIYSSIDLTEVLTFIPQTYRLRTIASCFSCNVWTFKIFTVQCMLWRHLVVSFILEGPWSCLYRVFMLNQILGLDHRE